MSYFRITLKLKRKNDDDLKYFVLYETVDETEENGPASDRYKPGVYSADAPEVIGIFEHLWQSDTYSGLFYELYPTLIEIKLEDGSRQDLLGDLIRLDGYENFTWSDGTMEDAAHAALRLQKENEKLRNRIHLLEHELGNYIDDPEGFG